MIPARYDLLCIEGIARALRIFLQKSEAPIYKLVYPPGGESELLQVKIDPEVGRLISCVTNNAECLPDSQNQTLVCLRHFAEYQVHGKILRLFYRSAR